jgi:NitT/TauT family transport system permease protein
VLTDKLRFQPLVVPSPGQVWAVFAERGDYLWRSTTTTAAAAGLGFVLAVGIGVVAGALLASWPPAGNAWMPELVGLDAIPKIALAPSLVLLLGFGTTPKVVIVVLTCLLPIVLATIRGLTRTPTTLVELARSLTASWWATLIKIRFPAAIPRIFVGIRIAAPASVIGAVVGEFVGGAVGGLGYAIRGAGADFALVGAALGLLAAISLCIYGTVAGLERLLAPWTRQVTA